METKNNKISFVPADYLTKDKLNEISNRMFETTPVLSPAEAADVVKKICNLDCK